MHWIKKYVRFEKFYTWISVQKPRVIRLYFLFGRISSLAMHPKLFFSNDSFVRGFALFKPFCSHRHISILLIYKTFKMGSALFHMRVNTLTHINKSYHVCYAYLQLHQRKAIFHPRFIDIKKERARYL